LDRDDDDAVVGLEDDVDEQQPPPRSQEEAKACPVAAQLRSHEREGLQCAQRSRDPGGCVGRKTVRANEAIEILEGRHRELDASHELQLVESDGVAGLRLLQAELSALVGAGDGV